ncbi:Rne/Rng family ribonuclease [Vacuolonema iberomarrocanum]|uniref:Rne/Rng family ribonuclease n=1 Tax=Vacuolonema iberomarrocanum TaxID=3454632 RepID=UPI001A097018|nr:Rne/Rng family ribonuclease [filamentous cyanobacterium LEGE 07170]
MPKQIVIAEQHRIAAVFSEDQIQELIVATGSHQVGDIYLGIVENVLPGIDAAFVNIGDSERNGFIHVSDLGPLRLKKSMAPITELLLPQQKVLVQIMKEPTGNKGPRLTGNITLPGRYLVLMPFGRGVNLSRRIRNESERNRLRALAILVKPAGMGLLVRTEAEGVSEEAIIEDLELLQKQWETVQQEALGSRPPCLLNRDDDFIQKVLRDVYSSEVNRIVADSQSGMKRVKQHLTNWGGGQTPSVVIDQHREKPDILEYFRVNAAIREALKPRVDLPSGGYIIIERTEALTVIDVNSGSFTRSATARETVLWTNCEAADEIARQLRLRNIAGVIVVDFIDMDSHRDKLQVLEQFNKALRTDKARPQIAQLTELGLVELTRKRQGQNIYELFGRPCPTCSGLGHLVHLPNEPEEAVHALEDGRTVTNVRPTVRVAPSDNNGGGFADTNGEDPLSANLTSHPSYQERSKPDRRRSKRGGRSRNGDSSSRKSTRSAPSETAPLPAEALPNLEATPEVISEKPTNGKPTKESRSERGGRSRREKAPAEPPETISIEMTPDEQELYAMMGISPLVLAREAVKDPKNAVISVYLPGMAPPPELPNGKNGQAATPSADVSTGSEETAKDDTVASSAIDSSQDDASDAIAEATDATKEEDSSSSDNSTVNRRRRRRSSARSS